MESAALEAYQKDVESNADITSIAINKRITSASTEKVWQETKSPDGKIYYWNTSTNETIWKPPAEGYLSLAEQKEITAEATRQQYKTVAKQQILQDRLITQEKKQQDAEERARIAREKLKEKRVEQIPEVEYAPIIPPGKSTPYGQWQTIQATENTMDLQLPQQEQYEAPIYEEPEPEPEEPPQRQFKEKIVLSLGSSNVGFKKRKIGSSVKRNARQRLDDD